MKTYHKLNRFPLGAIKAEGFLKEQMLRGKDGMAGHLYELEPDIIKNPYLGLDYNIKEWAGGAIQLGWGAEISGHYWTGYIQHAFVLNDPEMIKTATWWIDTMMKTQREDGYLGTYYKNDEYMYDDYNAWGTSCAMRGLLAFYEATGREDVLQAAYRCLKWFVKNWSGDKKTTYAGAGIIDTMVTCYYLTGDEELIKFCEDYTEFMAEHTVYRNSYKHFLENTIYYYSNHTVAVGTMAKCPALLYSANGNEKYLKASENYISMLRKKYMQLTGGFVSHAEWLGAVSAVTETEYCCNEVFNLAYSHMSYITGEAKYGDYMEEVFYNSAQGARKKDERAIAYMSAPNQVYATDTSTISGPDPDMQAYAPCYPTACCPVMAVAIVPEFVRGMMLKDDSNNIYMTAYGPCSLKYEGISINELTDYPFRNNVTFDIKAKNQMSVFLKIPGWAKGYSITLNGESITAEKNADGYVEVNHLWSGNDTLTITFDAEVEVVQVDDSDAGKKHPIAFKYGALLYSYHIPERWKEIKGNPSTPLPEDWSWFNVTPDIDYSMYTSDTRFIDKKLANTWNVAVDENLSPTDVTVEEVEKQGYVWENPMIKLHTTCYKAPHAYPVYPRKTYEPFGDKQPVTDKLPLTLVPFGCTNLRITYFPRADLKK